jgi:hypothetical protein
MAKLSMAVCHQPPDPILRTSILKNDKMTSVFEGRVALIHEEFQLDKLSLVYISTIKILCLPCLRNERDGRVLDFTNLLIAIVPKIAAQQSVITVLCVEL